MHLEHPLTHVRSQRCWRIAEVYVLLVLAAVYAYLLLALVFGNLHCALLLTGTHPTRRLPPRSGSLAACVAAWHSLFCPLNAA